MKTFLMPIVLTASLLFMSIRTCQFFVESGIRQKC